MCYKSSSSCRASGTDMGFLRDLFGDIGGLPCGVEGVVRDPEPPREDMSTRDPDLDGGVEPRTDQLEKNDSEKITRYCSEIS